MASLFEDSFTTRKNSEELACFQLDPESAKYKTTSQELKALMSASQLEQGNKRYQDLVRQRVQWIRKKADECSSGAQYDLGWCYRDGYGVPKDHTEALKWYLKAAEQGHSKAATSHTRLLREVEATDAEVAYHKQKSARELNIHEVDRECSRLARFAQASFILLALCVLTSIIAVVRGTWPVATVSGCCAVGTIAFVVRFTRQIARLRKLHRQISNVESAVRVQRENARRQREGIRARHERDVVAEAAEWNKANHVTTDWVEGQTRSLLPGDVVLKWDHHVQRGLCLQRDGKIIANRVLMYISW